MSEWLRSSTRNRLGLARTGSSPVVPEGGRALHKSMHMFTPSASRALFTGFDSQGVTFSSRHVVRAVKEMDSKSIGLCPRRFESCTCRERPPHPVLAQLAERLTVAVYTQIPSIGHRFDSGKPEIETGRVERHSIPLFGDQNFRRSGIHKPRSASVCFWGELSMKSGVSIRVLLQHRRLLFELNV